MLLPENPQESTRVVQNCNKCAVPLKYKQFKGQKGRHVAR